MPKATFKHKDSRFLNVFYQIWPFFIIFLLPLIVFSRIFFGFTLLPGCVLYNEFYPWKDAVDSQISVSCKGSSFWSPDPLISHYPWKISVMEAFKNKSWPLWNPFMFAGTPLMANNQSAAFYPFNLIYLILNFNNAWNLVSVSQPILAGLFFYLLLRKYGLSKLSSLWGGLIYSWNGVMAAYFHYQVIGHTLLWLPLSIYFLILLDKKFSLKYFLFLVASLALMLLAGHFQYAFYCFCIIVFLLLVEKRKRGMKYFLIGLFFSIGLASVQILPTLEFITHVSRDLNLLYKDSFLADLPQLLRLIVPRMFGDPTLGNWWGHGGITRDHQYIGLLGLLFVLLGIYFSFRHRKWRGWLVLSLLILFFSIDSVFTRFIYKIPIPLWSTVTPTRLLGMIVFPFALLSSVGFEYFTTKKKSFGPLIFCTLFIFLVLSAIYVWTLNQGYMSSIYRIVKDSLSYPVKLLVITSVLVLLSRWFGKFKIGLLLILVLLNTGDLIRENQFFTSKFIKNEYLYKSTPLIDFLSENKQDRFISFDGLVFFPSTSIPYHLETVSGYDTLILRHYSELAQMQLRSDPKGHEFDNRAIKFSLMNEKLVDLLNIRYVLAKEGLDNNRLRLVEKIGSVFVYENKSVLPRAFLVSDFKVASGKEALKEIFLPEFNPAKTVILNEMPESTLEDGDGKVEFIGGGFSKSSWEVSTTKTQMLFVSETDAPGWNAYVDGRKTKIYRANYAFKSLIVPSGKHVVTLEYSPKSFRVGLTISFLALLTFVFCRVSCLFLRRVDPTCKNRKYSKN